MWPRLYCCDGPLPVLVFCLACLALTGAGVARPQLQGMVGGQYSVRSGLAITFGFIAGKYEASPRIGGQLGLSMDFPGLFRGANHGRQ